MQIDLGDRVVVARHAGRGHTDGDAAVLVPDCGVAFLGDLVEESGPPSFGPDSWPLDWPDTLATILADLAGDAVVVPGHGAPVDLEFARAQCADIATVASVIRQRLDTGVALADAQREPDARLPYPLEVLAEAFARGWHSG
jgi:glyoxylase-like metal-dependent hydrolase (beta-lactamase superfamily II)